MDHIRLKVRTQTHTDKRYHHSRIYFLINGESLVENLLNRRSRPTKLYRRLLNKVYTQLREQGEILPQDQNPQDVKWSQTAGCSCGCSPGFIMRDCWRLKNKDIYVSIE